jgi:spermidine/putrescine transport system ATP-binding protein
VKPEDGIITGTVTSLLFKGVHYEMDVMANGHELLVHSTNFVPVGNEVGVLVDPYNIQIMHKPESEDEQAAELTQ